MAGYTISRTIAAASTNAALVASRPAQINGWQITNAAAYAVFVKFYNSATIPTAGAGTPVMTIGVPAGVSVAASFNADPAGGVTFSAGLGFTITKLVADNDTTVLVANDCVMNLFWK